MTTIGRATGRRPALRVIADIWKICVQCHGFDVYVVAEFSLRFAPLIALVARLNGALCVVDCFVGKEETVIGDHRMGNERSFRAWSARMEDRRAARAGDILLVDTDVRRDALATLHTDREVISLPVGAPGWARPRARGPLPDALTVLFYGSLLPLHGVPTILEAIAEMRCPVHLTIIGDTTERDVAELIARLGIEDRCSLQPPVPASELAEAMARSDVVLGIFGTSPKARSVIANKVWQGLACGRLVITQVSPALDEIRGIVGEQLVEVPAGSPSALASALSEHAGRRPSIGWATTGERLEAYVATRFVALDDALERPRD